MEKIDVFNHIYPPGYYNFFLKRHPMVESMSRELPALIDMDSRLKVMDSLGVDREILSLALPSIDDAQAGEEDSRRLTMSANDSIMEVADRSGGRFLAIGTVSLSDPAFAVEEAERCVRDLKLLGVQIVSNVKGEPVDLPHFEPFFSVMEKLNAPVWIHPTFMRERYSWLKDFQTDIMVGWDFDTTLSLIRLAASGLMERHRQLKIIVHHLGSLVPVLAGRIASFISRPDGDMETVMKSLKSFYVDTAEGMWNPWLESALKFFGTGHVMFGTDFPWGDSAGIIANIEKSGLSENEMKMVYSGNAKSTIGFR